MRRVFLVVCFAALTSAMMGVLTAAEPQAKSVAPSGAAEEVTDFSLLDQDGRYYQLRRQTEAKAVVLMIGGNGCPIVRQNVHKFQVLREKFSGKKVRFWMLNANSQDDLAGIRAEANEFKIAGPILKDEAQLVAHSLGVKRTAEVIAINTKDWTIFYRGALDDQLVEGGTKPQPTENYLENALLALLSNKEISPTRTRPAGCVVHYEAHIGKTEREVSYASEVAPILAGKCVSCHSEGNIGPFNMSSYKAVKGYSDTIREVLLNKQMPPWHADPHFGRFQDDRSISISETRTLVGWIDAGCPRGGGNDPLVALAAQPPKEDQWTLGRPDFIVAPSQTMTIPATGVVEYITNIVESPLVEDAWLRAAVIRPDNKKVLHHAIVYLDFPESQRKGRDDKDNWLTGWAPGYRMAAFPEGTGKFLPKGTKLRWQLHYTTMGSEQADRTELGLYLLKEKPQVEIEIRGVWNGDFKIPPGSRDARTLALKDFPRDMIVYELNPHMHKRGSWFRFEALYPDGHFETLLSVPKYDFNWQTGYRLAEPKRLPGGTRILCTGGFDNSKQNPSNPDPKKEVHWGDQSWEEMFIGFMTVSEVPGGSGHAKNTAKSETVSVARGQ
ncbi:MAG: redoxin domain-containing protein [Verrucomicrobiales bacterium]|nr:redoxin domain-containing protein [Verrucomicrobiales bacterium]